MINVTAFFDRDPIGANKDYDAITFATIPTASNTFRLECPLNEFVNRSLNYQLNIRFISKNGLRKQISYPMQFVSDNPDLTNVFTQPLTNRSLWSTTHSSAQSPATSSKLIDGQLDDIWHTAYSPTVVPYPHSVTFNRNAKTSFNTIALFNRENLVGAFKDFDVQVSEDGMTWTNVGTYELSKIAGANYFTLPNTFTSQYIKITATSGHDKDVQYTDLAEFDVF